MGLLVKLLPLALLFYGYLRAPSSVRGVMSSFREAPAIMRTTNKLAAAQNALAFEYLNSDRWPYDVEDFLNRNVSGPFNPGRDEWGTPLRLVDGHTPEAAIVSCGPDRECDTRDDLSMRLIPKKKRPPGADAE